MFILRKGLFIIIALMFMNPFVSISSHAAEDELLGAGATFPYPLYSKMFNVYHSQYGVKVNYQSIGSGGGIRQLINKTVDFGATDSFMTEEELEKASGDIVHIPTCLGAVVVTYNLPRSPQIRFTPDVLADIFLGTITSWNDPALARINPDITLPNMKIMVVHRSDGSGTTFIFTDYLSKVSEEWAQSVSKGKSVRWRTGIGAKGNEGLTGLVNKIPGSIGYVELAYTIQNNMPHAVIKNADGNFVKPSIESTSNAARIDLPVHTRVSITNTPAPQGYPISGFTWILVYKNQEYNSRSHEKAKTLVDLLWWMTHEGQNYAKPLHYAPLPDEVVAKAERIITSITYSEEPLKK